MHANYTMRSFLSSCSLFILCLNSTSNAVPFSIVWFASFRCFIRLHLCFCSRKIIDRDSNITIQVHGISQQTAWFPLCLCTFSSLRSFLLASSWVFSSVTCMARKVISPSAFNFNCSSSSFALFINEIIDTQWEELVIKLFVRGHLFVTCTSSKRHYHTHTHACIYTCILYMIMCVCIYSYSSCITLNTV